MRDNHTLAAVLAAELREKTNHVENVIALLDEGCTVPFIARYRKELHGTMDDQRIRELSERLAYLRNLDKRREEIAAAVEAQGKLTEELSAALEAAQTLAALEDLYRPYRQKRRTKASMAREKGLQPLADALFAQDRREGDIEAMAAASLGKARAFAAYAVSLSLDVVMFKNGRYFRRGVKRTFEELDGLPLLRRPEHGRHAALFLLVLLIILCVEDAVTKAVIMCSIGVHPCLRIHKVRYLAA